MGPYEKFKKNGLNNVILTIPFLIIHELENKDGFCFYNFSMFSVYLKGRKI